jgi:DNA-binding transcriptional regulator YiaG
MPNIGSLLRDEISRLCRRELKRQVGPLRKAVAAGRRDVATLKRQLADADRRMRTMARQGTAAAKLAAAPESGKPIRFVAKGLKSLRERLGVSQADFARLVGVSGQTVYNWETRKATPRREQLERIAGLRSIGKREAAARLEATPAPAAGRKGK